MSDLLFVTWDGGGNVPPATAIARELQQRGHTVRFLGHATQRSALVDAGFEFVEPTRARPFSSLDPNSPLTMMSTFGDRGIGHDLLAELAARPADLVVVDCLMFGAMAAAAEAGVRFAVLEHLYDGFYQRGILGGPMSLNLRLRGLRPVRTLAAAEARILTTLPSLDPVAPSSGLHQVGPVVAVRPRVAADPVVLVSLSTYRFSRMRENLQQVVDATRDLPARVVVTTGPAIDPATITAPEGVEVHRYVPHVELFGSTTLFVGHGGHGSTMQALAHDVPMVLMPMDRLTDQPLVARSIAASGAGTAVRKGTRTEALAPLLADALADALGDGPHRRAAARLGAEVRLRPGASRGADVAEELAGRPVRA